MLMSIVIYWTILFQVDFLAFNPLSHGIFFISVLKWEMQMCPPHFLLSTYKCNKFETLLSSINLFFVFFFWKLGQSCKFWNFSKICRIKHTECDFKPNPAGTRRLQDILRLSWNCLVSIRHFQDIYKTSSCRWHAIDISKIS